MAGFMDCNGELEFGGTSGIGRRIVNQFQLSPHATGAPESVLWQRHDSLFDSLTVRHPDTS